MRGNEDFWNPVDLYEVRINPFERFDSWRHFLEYYVTPENEIERRSGPGNHIGDGEWYITLLEPEFMNEGKQRAFLSYVVPKTSANLRPNQRIKYIPIEPPESALKLGGKLNHLYFNTGIAWTSGSKNNWGGRAYLHYKVEFNKGFGISFINWPNENPLEVKE